MLIIVLEIGIIFWKTITLFVITLLITIRCSLTSMTLIPMTPTAFTIQRHTTTALGVMTGATPIQKIVQTYLI